MQTENYIYRNYIFDHICVYIYIYLGYDILNHFDIVLYSILSQWCFEGSQAHRSALCERCRGSDLDEPFPVVASFASWRCVWGFCPEKTGRTRSISTHGRGKGCTISTLFSGCWLLWWFNVFSIHSARAFVMWPHFVNSGDSILFYFVPSHQSTCKLLKRT